MARLDGRPFTSRLETDIRVSGDFPTKSSPTASAKSAQNIRGHTRHGVGYPTLEALSPGLSLAAGTQALPQPSRLAPTRSSSGRSSTTTTTTLAGALLSGGDAPEPLVSVHPRGRGGERETVVATAAVATVAVAPFCPPHPPTALCRGSRRRRWIARGGIVEAHSRAGVLAHDARHEDELGGRDRRLARRK